MRWGTNTENFNKKFYKQCALGYGPQHRKRLTHNNVQDGGAQHREIVFQFLQAMKYILI